MTRTGLKKVQKLPGNSVQSAAIFKYYIHDTSDGYCLEMFGPFTKSSLSELSSCWRTAKTTLNNRTLTLDLRGLTAVDEGARQWLEDMNLEGATCLPLNFLRDSIAGQPNRESPEPARVSIYGRLRILFAAVLKPAQ